MIHRRVSRDVTSMTSRDLPLVVAAIMAGLALQGAWIVVRQSLSELRQPLAVRRDAEIEKAI
jgi:hypothetical protein